MAVLDVGAPTGPAWPHAAAAIATAVREEEEEEEEDQEEEEEEDQEEIEDGRAGGSSRTTTDDDDVGPRAAPRGRPAFFSWGCGRSISGTLLLYCAALALAALLAHAQRHLVRCLRASFFLPSPLPSLPSGSV
jgi:hypothetical protein